MMILYTKGEEKTKAFVGKTPSTGASRDGTRAFIV
jgi:hypothetical protein